MKYFKLLLDDENSTSDQMVCFTDENFEGKYNINKYDIYSGVSFEDWNDEFTFYYDKDEGDRPTDYLANDIGWFLISPKFREILDKLEVNNVQYLPVKIKEKTSNNQLDGFFVVNIIGLVDALDLDNSNYDIFEVSGVKMLSVVKYALKNKELSNLHLVRLKDSQFATFVSEELRNELIRNKITGCDFLEVKVMDKYNHTRIVIDRLEYYITKEIEKSIYGDGDKCFTALYDRLMECINARNEINYNPIYKNAREILWDFGYDEDFINTFLKKAKSHSKNKCPDN